MAETNGTAKRPLNELKEEYQRARLEERTAGAKARKRMMESLWGNDPWDFGGSDLFFRARADGGENYVPISVPSDRRHGQQWPLWRTEPELDRIRQQGRLLVGVNSFAQALLRNRSNYTIGKGFGYKAVSKELIDADPNTPGVQDPEAVKQLVRQLQDFLDDFLARNRWNATTDRQDALVVASTRERECYRRHVRDGEAILRFWHEDDGHTMVRFVEPECMRNPPGGTPQKGWFAGVRHQMDPFEDVETPVEYFFWHQDPATVKPGVAAEAVGEFVPANEVLHMKGPDTDASAARGITDFSFDTARALERASKLQRNISEGACVRAATAEIWKSKGTTKAQMSAFAGDLQTGSYTDPYSESNGTVATQRRYPASVRLVPEHLEPVLPPADQSTAGYIEAETGDLRQAASASASPEFFFANASNSNYSSLETAAAPPVKNGECEQEYYKAGFLAVLWKAVRWAVEKALLPRPILKFCDIQIEAPAVLHRDRLQKAQADQIDITAGKKSPQTCALEDGLDPEVEATNIQQWREMTGGQGELLPLPDEDGNTPPGSGAGMKGPGTATRRKPVLLDIPDVRQSTDYSCGRAALQSVLRAYGIEDDLADLGTDSQDGTRPAEIVAAAERLGLETMAGTFSRGARGLVQYLDQGVPVLCPIQAGDPAEGHWVVVCGYNADQVLMQDPVRGRVAMLAAELERRWHDQDADGRRYVRYGIVVQAPNETIHEAKKGAGGQFKKGGGRETGQGEKAPAAKKTGKSGAKSAAAVAAHKQKFVGKTVGAAEHKRADEISGSIAKSLGGKTEEETADAGQKDKKPYDVQVPKKDGSGNHDIEVKSLLKGEKQSISVHEDALLRKVNHAGANPQNTFHTVVRDDRQSYDGGAHAENYSGHDLYYKRGSGRYSLGQMHKVKDEAELKKLLETPDDQLPAAAQGSLPPPPPVSELKKKAAAASESRKKRDKERKARNKDLLREQARKRAALAKKVA